MQACCAASAARVGRPAAATSRRPQLQRGLPALPCRRPQLVCRAEGAEDGKAQQEAAVPPPPVPTEPMTAFDRQQMDMKNQPDALGPVGNALMAILLVVLCGASVFFTVGRQFQADLVPLTPEEVIAMTQ